MDIKQQYETAMAKKNELEKLVNSVRNFDNIENEEDKIYLKMMLDKALKTGEVDINALQERVKKMTHGS